MDLYFSLPPLLIHAFLFENSFYLNSWSKKLPQNKKGNCYLNFIASHDGIGIRPTEGILNKKVLSDFLNRLKKMDLNFLTVLEMVFPPSQSFNL